MRIGQRLGVVGLTATLITGVVAPNATLAAPPLPDIQIEISYVRVDPDPTFGPNVPEPYPGSADPDIIFYDPKLWRTSYKCSFAGWARYSVYWSCRVADRFTFLKLAKQQGTFSDGSENPGPWFIYRPRSAICVEAHAHYQNWVGSFTSSSWECG
jgi:hypothetical protein